jgi:hypothetical protein
MIIDSSVSERRQTFGRLRLKPNQFMKGERDFSTAPVNVYRLRNDDAVYEVTGTALTR